MTPSALTQGHNTQPCVQVYFGQNGGQNVYAGSTNNLGRRSAQHGSDRFTLEKITTSGVSRGEARAIEEALIVRAGATRGEVGVFENLRHSISPKHDYYDDAVVWGEEWLFRNGG